MRRLITIIFLRELFTIHLDNPAIASTKFNQNKTFKLIVFSEDYDLDQKARLDRSLAIVNEMDNSQQKVILLNDLALNYAQLHDLKKAKAILDQSLSIAESFEDLSLKVTTKTNIVKYYAQIGQKPQAIKILDSTVELVSMVEDKSLQGQLLFEISLKYGWCL